MPRSSHFRSTNVQTSLLSRIPRSGTSLCCYLAGELPDVVALCEPIRFGAYGGMDGAEGAAARIPDFVEEARQRILAEHRAPSVQVGERLDDSRTAESHTDAVLPPPATSRRWWSGSGAPPAH